MTKICKYCKIDTDQSKLHWAGRDSEGCIKYRPCCRECWNEVRRKRKKNPLNNPRKSGIKFCSRCNIMKPVQEFGKQSSGSINFICALCYKVYEKLKAQQWTLKNLTKSRAIKRKHFENNREQFAHRAKIWRQLHPEFHRATEAKRRAQKMTTVVEKIEYKTLAERDSYTCYLWCKKKLTLKEITMDHVIPLSRGGTHTYDNIKVACLSCNIKKHNRLISELGGIFL